MGKGRTTVPQPWDVKHRHRKRFGPWPTVSLTATEERTAGAQSQIRQAGRLGNSVCSESHPGYVMRQLSLALASAVNWRFLIAVYEAARTMATRLASPGTRQKSAFHAPRKTRQPVWFSRETRRADAARSGVRRTRGRPPIASGQCAGCRGVPVATASVRLGSRSDPSTRWWLR